MNAEILEVAMLLSFGAAWPASIAKSLRSRTAKGKSVAFLLIIALGYVAGIAAKFAGGRVNYVVAFYFVNLAAVLLDTAIWFRNRRLDAEARAIATSETVTIHRPRKRRL